MKRYGPIAALTRREFLLTAAIVPALTSVSGRSAGVALPGREPAYLALEPFIVPGRDGFSGEAEAFARKAALRKALQERELPLAENAQGLSPHPASYQTLAADLLSARFERGDLASGWRKWNTLLGEIRRAEFYVLPHDLVRFEVSSFAEGKLHYRVGTWKIRWESNRIVEFTPLEEHVTSAAQPWFRDVTAHAFGGVPDVDEQLRCGIPYWRARLDPASGIDIYGSNGIAVGDIDDDGVDEIYVCQPGGLPNRLLKVGTDGTVSDLSAAWGVNMLDDTSCALFLDLRNTGRQDLVVLRGGGPVLFVHAGARYRMRTDAFRFAELPKGGFTGMAAADFDRDGRLDLYLCSYVYFQSEAQYTYASPYQDAQNGPPNFLLRNRLAEDGSGVFEDCTAETGLNENNNRFSFAPAWCDYNDDGWPDLYVANDFGRKNLYRNRSGHFRDVAAQSGVEDIGPGMSAAWFDYDGDGRADLYVANMWTEAGQRLIADKNFAPAQRFAEAYRGHTMGNSLFRNRGDGAFEDATEREHVAFGRWAWSSGGHDLDNDGTPELVVTCGMLTNQSHVDLSSFFWRQVVARSPVAAGPSANYENGWNALNQFVREDYSWSGHEPNVVHARRGGRFYDFSGVSGLDFAQDSRAFAVTDFDGDGRPDIILKSRLGPQIRLLQNQCSGANYSIALRLRGTESNRDAIGARVRVDGQTKWLDGGSGFLSQHSKRMTFGLGEKAPGTVEIRWPSGREQQFAGLAAGHTHSIVEGKDAVTSEPFRAAQPLPHSETQGGNEMRSVDTWFLEPVPLPSPTHGPALFVIREAKPEYEIFRRYLFDWRAPLTTPTALLLNGSGDVVKIYGQTPTPEQVTADLKILATRKQLPALPFPGFFVAEPARDFFKFGAAFLWAGYPAMALPYLERVLERTPDNARVLVLIGQIRLETNEPDVAGQAFTKALAVDSTSVNALIGLGDIAVQRGRAAEASARYERALAIDPQAAEAANALGLLVAKGGDSFQAQHYFERAIAARRNYAEAINNLAVLYSGQGKMNDAISAWNYGIKMAPDEDILYLNLGRTYVRLGANDKARMTMQQLLDRKPENATARRALQELEGR